MEDEQDMSVIKDGRILGIIPARGESKTIPKKNIRLLCNQPLIAYTIESAQQSRYIDRFVVSTDNQEIARISKQRKAEVIMRDHSLAEDESPTILALQHVIRYLKESEGYRCEIVVTLQPTSPLRENDFIDKAVKEFLGSNADSLVGVRERSAKFGEIKKGYFVPGYQEGKRRQDLEPTYEEDGSIYITREKAVMKQNSMFGKKILAFIVDGPGSIDIDTYFDFELAEAILKSRRGK